MSHGIFANPPVCAQETVEQVELFAAAKLQGQPG
jgi:hypothetical protein